MSRNYQENLSRLPNLNSISITYNRVERLVTMCGVSTEKVQVGLQSGKLMKIFAFIFSYKYIHFCTLQSCSHFFRCQSFLKIWKESIYVNRGKCSKCCKSFAIHNEIIYFRSSSQVYLNILILKIESVYYLHSCYFMFIFFVGKAAKKGRRDIFIEKSVPRNDVPHRETST